MSSASEFYPEGKVCAWYVSTIAGAGPTIWDFDMEPHVEKDRTMREKVPRSPKVLRSLGHPFWHLEDRKINFIFSLNNCVWRSLSWQPNLESLPLQCVSLCIWPQKSLSFRSQKQEVTLDFSLPHHQYSKWQLLLILLREYFYICLWSSSQWVMPISIFSC